VCDLLGNTVRKFLSDLLYENVNDGPTRRTLRSSLGFCRLHAGVLLASGDALGAAILYRDILEEILSLLHKRSPSALVPGQECPACLYRNRYERIYLETLREYAGDARMQSSLRASGLCRPHLQQLIESPLPQESRKHILEAQAVHIARMRMTLGEFLRKQDIRCKAEGVTDEEKTACSAAIAFMAGKNV
jgi:hypothetical protein